MTEKAVVDFYNEGCATRMAPGRKDGDNQTQKRHLLTNINEVYELFKSERPDIVIGRSKFASLRPNHVRPFGEIPQNVCVCQTHENVRLILSSLRTVSTEVPSTPRDLITLCCCDRTSPICMGMTAVTCVKCKSVRTAFSLIAEQGNENVMLSQWERDDTNRVTKLAISITVADLLGRLEKKWADFISHCYINDIQGEYFREARTSLISDTESCVIQVDFAENFHTSFQDEIQSAHFVYKQVTLFTAVVWSAAKCYSYVIVSDNIKHDKESVHAFLAKLLTSVKCELPQLKSVRFFSDGATSQFKQKFLMSSQLVVCRKFIT